MILTIISPSCSCMPASDAAKILINQSIYSNINIKSVPAMHELFNCISLGMGTVENSTVRFGFRFCFYGSVLSRFTKRFINDISWIRNYAMECVAELAWTCKFLYTSSLASFSMLRRLLRIVKVAREQEAPFIVTLKWLFDGALDRHCEASSADSFITPPACIENRTAWRGVRFQTG